MSISVDDIKPSQWIGQLISKGKRQNKTPRVGDLTLIGTHDSQSYQIGRFKGSERNFINNLAIHPVIGPLVRWGAVGSAITQSLTIKEQLEHGVRALDLRLAWDSDKKQFFLAHTVGCILLEDALDQIQEFRRANSDEMIILQFGRDYENRETLNNDVIRLDAFNRLYDKFSNSLWNPAKKRLSEQALSEMSGKVVISCSNRDELFDPMHRDVFAFSLSKNWANKASVKEVIEIGESVITEEKQKNELFFVDASPTPSTEQTIALIIYHASNSFRLYSATCVLIRTILPALKKFNMEAGNALEIISKHLDESQKSNISENGKIMAIELNKKLIEKKDDERYAGMGYSIDFFGQSLESHELMKTCIKRSAAKAEIRLDAEFPIHPEIKGRSS